MATTTIQKNWRLRFVGLILDGQLHENNPKWYLLNDGTFVWAGCVTEQTNVRPILDNPLSKMVCTQRFGERPWFYEELGSPRGHNGLDFRTRDSRNNRLWKQPVSSVLDGVVMEAKYKQYLGNYVRINHSNKWESVYLHLNSIDVVANDKVKKGQVLGVSGKTETDAPHLHFGFRPADYDKSNGYMGYINPVPYFKNKIKFVAT